MGDVVFNILPFGPRRRTPTGKALHCCVVCNKLSPWGDKWAWYGSLKEEDDGTPIQKFCSNKCKKNQSAVTLEMCAEAREKEYSSSPMAEVV